MIEELITRVFAVRNVTHLAHWKTRSYAAHMALGSFYESVVEALDGIVECYQGESGLVSVPAGRVISARITEVAPDDVVDLLRDEADWIQANREEIAGNNSALQNLIDELLAQYYTTIYKLEFLA